VSIREAMAWVVSGAQSAKRAASQAWGVMVISARPEFAALYIRVAARSTATEISGVCAEVWNHRFSSSITPVK